VEKKSNKKTKSNKRPRAIAAFTFAERHKTGCPTFAQLRWAFAQSANNGLKARASLAQGNALGQASTTEQRAEGPRYSRESATAPAQTHHVETAKQPQT